MKLTDLIRPLVLFTEISALTGGGAGKLDGIPTVDLDVTTTYGGVVVGGSIYFYQLQAGTTAESSPTVIRPDDYEGGTNEKIWVLLGITAGGGGGTFLVAANNLSDVVNAATARSNLGLVIGTHVQAYDAELAAIAGLTSAADKGIQFTGSGTAGTFDLTAAGKALLDDADAAAQRATLGLGAAATKAVGTGASEVAIGTAGLVAIPFVIDGGGAVITTGSKGFIAVPSGVTLNKWVIFGDQTGDIVVDVKKCDYTGFPTTSSIAASAKPTLSTAQKNVDSTLTGWTTALTAQDILEFYVDSAATVQRVTVILYGVRT